MRTLNEWDNRRRYCTRRQLKSLVGLLHHTTKVFHMGRSFLHRMSDLLKGRPVRRLYYLIRLNSGFRADLLWWRTVVHSWNGISYLPPPEAAFEFASDASSTWGVWCMVEESMVPVVLVPNICTVIHRDERAYPNHCSDSSMGPDVERPVSTLSLRQYGSDSSLQRSHCS